MLRTGRVLSVASAFILVMFSGQAFGELQYFGHGGASSPPPKVSSQSASHAKHDMGGGSPAVGYDLHVQAPHMMEDGTPGGPYHHYCKGISDKILQCLLFESTAANAPPRGC